MITYHKPTQAGELPNGLFLLAYLTMGLALIGPFILMCSCVLLKALLIMCSSKCPGFATMGDDLLQKLFADQQLESIYDKLLYAIWPFFGPLFFFYAKCTKDQEKLNNFYRRYWWELASESSVQMIIQWYVIANYREVIEGTSQIPFLGIEYNQLAWAIASAILSTAGVANGLRLWIETKRGEWTLRKGARTLWTCLCVLGLWIAEVYILGQFKSEDLANQPSNITLVPTTSTTTMQ